MAKKIEMNDDSFFNTLDVLAVKIAERDLTKAEWKKAKVDLDIEYGDKIKALKDEIAVLEKPIKKYAITHRKRLLGDSKSATTSATVWGFEWTPPKVIPVKKSSDDDMVHALLQEGRKGTDFLSITHKLDKSKIADALNAGVEWLAGLFKQTQSEQFYCKVKNDNNKDS